MYFELVGDIDEIEVIAKGRAVRQRRRLNKRFGRGRWRKLKGVGIVRLADGSAKRAEIHWYEAHGLGRQTLKIKRFLD